MQSYDARYASFTPPLRAKSSSRVTQTLRWPHPTSFLATPATLAAAGFYFNPSVATPDAVSCFICDKGLADWDPDDDPAQIHAQKCPKCPWAILKCVKDIDDHGSVKFPSRPSSRVMEKARLATFGPEGKKWWPHDTKNRGPTSKMMAKAGFIYVPARSKDDTCACIHCGIELGGWQPEDDPMEEHRSRQAKKGPCPFFADKQGLSAATKRARSKSKPPSTPAASSSDHEYRPPGTRSSTRATSSKQPGSSGENSKPSRKVSKKTAKAKATTNEVVAEYDIALDEDAPPKPRPKPRRGSSRSRSRGSTLSASTATDEIEVASSSTKKKPSTKSVSAQDVEESQPKPGKGRGKSKVLNRGPNLDDDTQPARGLELDSSSHAGQPSMNGLAKATAMHADHHVPEYSKMKPTEFLQGASAPIPARRPYLTSFQSAEDEELAREEQALEDQVRELLLVDTTLKVLSTPSDGGKQCSIEQHRGAILPEMSPVEDSIVAEGHAFPMPSTLDPPATRVAYPAIMKLPQPISQELVAPLTDAERAMTVEQWVRHEMNRQYERLRSDGRQKIDAFKARAVEVAKRIERL